MTGPAAKYVTTLDCRSLLTGEYHRLFFRTGPPFLWEQVWCPRCQDMGTVIDAPYQWQARCLSCSYKPRASTSKTDAYRAAAAHLGRKHSHRVQVRRNGLVVERLEARSDTLSESFADLLTTLGVVR